MGVDTLARATVFFFSSGCYCKIIEYTLLTPNEDLVAIKLMTMDHRLQEGLDAVAHNTDGAIANRSNVIALHCVGDYFLSKLNKYCKKQFLKRCVSIYILHVATLAIMLI